MAQFDPSQLTPAQLEAIGNAVLRELIARQSGGASRDEPHDKHVGMHTKYNILEIDDAEPVAEFE